MRQTNLNMYSPTLSNIKQQLPDTDGKVVCVHSGGLDSSVALMMLVEHYGAENVISLGYDYGQKQGKPEKAAAKQLCKELGVVRHVLDLPILGEVARDVCANISGSRVEMPTIKDVLGHPQPPTYVPYRNMILCALTMAFAESNKALEIFMGLQVHDEYGYWDTTQKFVDSLNAVSAQNRQYSVEIHAPFSLLSKADEIMIAEELGYADLLRYTFTCYDPVNLTSWTEVSCGKCPSCAERIQNFMKVGREDPLQYNIDINWS